MKAFARLYLYTFILALPIKLTFFPDTAYIIKLAGPEDLFLVNHKGNPLLVNPLRFSQVPKSGIGAKISKTDDRSEFHYITYCGEILSSQKGDDAIVFTETISTMSKWRLLNTSMGYVITHGDTCLAKGLKDGKLGGYFLTEQPCSANDQHYFIIESTDKGISDFCQPSIKAIPLEPKVYPEKTEPKKAEPKKVEPKKIEKCLPVDEPLPDEDSSYKPVDATLELNANDPNNYIAEGTIPLMLRIKAKIASAGKVLGFQNVSLDLNKQHIFRPSTDASEQNELEEVQQEISDNGDMVFSQTNTPSFGLQNAKVIKNHLRNRLDCSSASSASAAASASSAFGGASAEFNAFGAYKSPNYNYLVPQSKKKRLH